jgi:hypothetical protein
MGQNIRSRSPWTTMLVARQDANKADLARCVLTLRRWRQALATVVVDRFVDRAIGANSAIRAIGGTGGHRETTGQASGYRRSPGDLASAVWLNRPESCVIVVNGGGQL